MKIYKYINYFIALVWLTNGLYCKLMLIVPRHLEIVAAILGETHAMFLTKTIGVLEILMALWVWTGYKSKWQTLLQIVLIATMNILEFILVPELLLWGHFNIVFAGLFIVLIYINEYYFKVKFQRRSLWDI